MDKIKSLYKYFYSLIPLKKEIFSIIKLVISPKKNIYKHLHFVGRITINVNQHSNFKMMHYGFLIENELFWAGLYGAWEKDSLRIWSELCKASNVILDIGANTGVYSLLAKTMNTAAAEVHSFDPVLRVYNKLVQNIELNRFDIKAYQLALSNNTGNATVYDIDAEHTYAVTVNQNRHSPRQG